VKVKQVLAGVALMVVLIGVAVAIAYDVARVPVVYRTYDGEVTHVEDSLGNVYPNELPNGRYELCLVEDNTPTRK
jgi:ABC-type siderophore export system fused ATPase/permease subunit